MVVPSSRSELAEGPFTMAVWRIIASRMGGTSEIEETA